MWIDEFKIIRKGINQLENTLNEFRLFLDPEKMDEYLQDIKNLKVWLYEVEETLYNSNSN